MKPRIEITVRNSIFFQCTMLEAPLFAAGIQEDLVKLQSSLCALRSKICFCNPLDCFLGAAIEGVSNVSFEEIRICASSRGVYPVSMFSAGDF
jgi:hypothetical protein